MIQGIKLGDRATYPQVFYYWTLGWICSTIRNSWKFVWFVVKNTPQRFLVEPLMDTNGHEYFRVCKEICENSWEFVVKNTPQRLLVKPRMDPNGHECLEHIKKFVLIRVNSC